MPHIASNAAYREHYGSYVEGLSPEGRIAVEDQTFLEGKELQLGKWLADAGHMVEFRNPNDHKGGNTSDTLLDGELWEFKRVESANVKQMARRITEKLDRQGPRFVVDLSVSNIDIESAKNKVMALLQDDAIEQIMLVHDGKAVLYE